QDRILRPRARGDARAIEADRLLEGPARGLDDAALDLVHDLVRVDDLSGVDRRDDARDPHLTRLAVDVDVGRRRAVAREVLVPGEGEAASVGAVSPCARTPARAPRRR